MFEQRHQPLLAYHKFVWRSLCCFALAVFCLGLTAAIGAAVYHGAEKMPWVEAFLNAVLVMTGLGLTVSLQTASAKVFTIFYALVSAIIFYAMVGVLFAPILHRVFHHFHLDADKKL